MVDGLRFACQPGCTNCCRVKGYVYISERDLLRIADFLGLSPEEFEVKYVYRTNHLLRLRKPRNNQCFFLRDSGCSIHAVKPTQCRVFPFWPELVENRDRWVDAGNTCPGIGQGPLVQIGGAMEIANEMRRAYPGLYGILPAAK